MTDVGVQTMLVSHTCPGSSLLRLQSFKRRSDSELYHISYDIATDTVGSALDANFISDKSCIHSATMRRVLTQFLKEQHQVLEKIIEDLNGESWDESDIDVMFMAIADQVFVDGKCNWGRIVALHGFVYKLVESVRKTEGKIVATSYAEKLSQLLAAYLSGSLAHWICAVGGWVRL